MMSQGYVQGMAGAHLQGYMQQQAFVPPLPDSQPPPPLPDEAPPPLPDGPPPGQALQLPQQQAVAMQGYMQGLQPASANTGAGAVRNGYAANNTGMQQVQLQQVLDHGGQMQLPQQQQWGHGMAMQHQGMGMQQAGMEAQQQWGQQTGVAMQQQPQGMMAAEQHWGQQQWTQQQPLQWGQQMNMQQQWGQQQQYNMPQQGVMVQNQHTIGQPSMAMQQGMRPQQVQMQQQMQLQQQQQEYERQQALMQKQYQRQQEYQQLLIEKQQQQMQMQMQQTAHSQADMGQWQRQPYMQDSGQQQMWSVQQQQMPQMPQMPQPPPPPRPAAMHQPAQVQQHLHAINAQLQTGMPDKPGGHMHSPAAVASAAMMQQIPAPTPPAPAPTPAVPAALEPPAPVDLRKLLQPPGRSQRPKRLLLILRGLPGSGKSYVAKAIRAKELEHSSVAPRLHSIDDYYMVDVEREVAADGSVVPTSSSSLRRQGSIGSKRKIVIEQEYQHDPDMEASYWKSLLRALGKTIASGDHSLVLLDAPAPKAEQVKEAWMAAESAGYEVMVVQPLTMDPKVCFKQNIHGRSLQDITAMAKAFEAPPSMYTLATAANLFKEAGLSDAPISDVDMTIDDSAAEQGGDGVASGSLPQLRQKNSRWEEDETEHSAGTAAAAAAVHGSTEQRSVATSADGDKDNAEGSDGVDTAAGAGSSRRRKKPKLLVQMNLDIDSEALLAGVNQALEQLDSDGIAGMNTPAAAAGGSGGLDDTGRGERGGSGRGAGSSMSMGGSHSSGAGKSGILKTAGTPGSKKKVRWPDDVLQDAEVDPPAGFSIARPHRQLEEVFWVAGLGPKGCWLDDDQEEDEASTAAAGSGGVGARAIADSRQVQQRLAGAQKHLNSFADQVRAEHKSEHNAFRAILLGHGQAAAAPQRQR